MVDNIDKMNLLDLRVLHHIIFQKREFRKHPARDILEFKGWEDVSKKHVREPTKIRWHKLVFDILWYGLKIFRSELSKYNVSFIKRIGKLVSLTRKARETKENLVESLSNFFNCPFQPTRPHIRHVSDINTNASHLR